MRESTYRPVFDQLFATSLHRLLFLIISQPLQVCFPIREHPAFQLVAETRLSKVMLYIMDLVVGNPACLFSIRVFDPGEEALILLIDLDRELLLEFFKVLGFRKVDIAK